MAQAGHISWVKVIVSLQSAVGIGLGIGIGIGIGLN